MASLKLLKKKKKTFFFFNLSYFIDRFCADSELSEVLSRLWEMDDNKCFPGKEYEINLQGKWNWKVLTEVELKPVWPIDG